MDDDARRRMFERFGGSFFNEHHRSPAAEPEDFGTFLRKDFYQMFREMDELLKQFTPNSFRIIDDPKIFAPPIESGPVEGAKRDDDGKLRDQFLKPAEPEADKKELDIPRAKSIPFGSGSLFDWLWTGCECKRSQRNKKIFDEDLDKKVAEEGLDKVIREDLFKNAPTGELTKREPLQPHIWASGQSVSIRRIQRPDGSIEEVKTVRNSDGHEERTVTRIMGDKSHSVIEKKNGKGIEETEEIFRNFDENKLGEFNDMWSNFNKRKAAIEPENKTTQDTPKGQPGPNNFSIASKLFSWFK